MTSMGQRIVRSALAAAVLLWCLPARSEPPASVKNLVEGCGALESDLARLMESEVALVDAGAVSRNGDNTYRLTTQVYTVGAGDFPLCSDSRFYGQKMVFGLPFRSAVQVGPDLVLTAWHGSTNGVTPSLYAIFGLRYRFARDRCIPPDLERVPAADVFSVTDVVADGLSSTTVPLRDFLLLRLDRDASAAFLRVRRSGRGRSDAGHQDSVTMVSHPDRLAAKLDLAGRLSGYADVPYTYTGPKVENIHPLQWSSGGMVYNRDAEVVETVCRSSVAAWYSRSAEGCYRVAQVNADHATNDSVADFAQHIPAFELLVTPLDTVVHEGLAGGPMSNPVMMRTVEAPVTAPGGIAYRIVLPDTTASGPELLVTPGGSTQGSLAPGTGFDVEETINVNGVPCGDYERTYSIIDTTHGFTDRIRHVFKIQCH